MDFILEGPSAMPDFASMTAEDFARRADGFRLLPDETLDGVLAAYDEVARRTSQVMETIPSLNDAWPLPKAPWFADESWTARRVLLHIASETAQHAGHADIIRESLDNAKSMA